MTRYCQVALSDRRQTFLGAVALSMVIAIGCGTAADSPPLIPVAGKITFDGQPATEGAVTFRDEVAGKFQPSGGINPDGTFKLMSGPSEGAPAGHYRVVVFVRKTPRTPSGEMAGLPKVIVNPKFTDPLRTPLQVEVKEGAPPGHYDFSVTK